MTIIEFFDSEMLENILGTLILQPDRVVIFGKDHKKIDAFIHRIQRILSKKGIHTQMLVATVNTNDFFAVKNMLYSFINTYPDCVFDLLGGEETVLTAMGAVSADKNIPLCSINPRSKRIKKIFPSGSEEKSLYETTLSVDDIITLFGGTLIEQNEIAPEYEQALLKLWNICKKDCARWNTAIEQLNFFIPSREACPDFDGVTVNIPKSRLNEGLKSKSYRYRSMVSVLSEICTSNLAKETMTDTEHIYTFETPNILSMLEKAGNVLELYTLYSVCKTKNDDNAPLVGSAASGVVIDWENPPDEGTEDDVINEIDVLATAGAIPVFISCKNGSVDSDELYKLNTVAQRFGGTYAKKILLMTYYDVTDSFIQRAQAMNIRLIRNVHLMDHQQLIQKLEDQIR